MLEERAVYLNGDLVPWDQAKIHLMSHGLSRGSAIFEVLSIHETEAGPAVFRLDEHLNRLFKTADLLDMQLPMSREALFKDVLNTVKQNSIRKGFIKIVGFYPQIAFEILPPQSKLDVAIFVVDPVLDLGGINFPFEKGTTLCISKWRKLDPQTVPIEAKAAANYLNGMLARSESRKRGFENALLLDTQGYIAEGGTESIFLVKDGRLITPSTGTILDSITRKSILQVSEDLGIPAGEGRLMPELLYEADEVFLSGTPIKVLPVRQVEERVFEEVPGRLTKTLQSMMKEISEGREERFKGWLFPVG
ncbi:branched-chain-amino-acid transaminase [Thermodesulfobacteriota bacterium]